MTHKPAPFKGHEEQMLVFLRPRLDQKDIGTATHQASLVCETQLVPNVAPSKANQRTDNQ